MLAFHLAKIFIHQLGLTRIKKRKPKKRWEEVLELDMIARGLQRLDAQDCALWRLNCKTRLTPTCWKNLLGSRNEGRCTLQEQNDDDEGLIRIV